MLNLNGYYSEAFTLLRRAHESVIKALAAKKNLPKAWKIIFDKSIQSAESAIGVEFKSIWTLESSFTHSNLMKIYETVRDMDKDDNSGVSFGPQMDKKLFLPAANLSIFWLYVLISSLPFIISNQVGNEWLSKQRDSAKLMKDYLNSVGALRKEVKEFDDAIKKLILSQEK